MPFAGHVAPVSAVVVELLARGHEVLVYTGGRYAERFERLGAGIIRWTEAPDFDEHDLEATFPAVGKRGPAGMLANLEYVFIRSGVGQARDLIAAHAQSPFDLIVGDVMSIGTGLTAERVGIPWATLSIVPLSLPSHDLPPAGLALQPGFGGVGTVRDGALRAVVRLFSGRLERAYREVRVELGLPSTRTRFDSALYSPWLVLATGGPSIEYPRSDLGAQFHFVGRLALPTVASAGHPDWWPDLLAATTPVVLVTQGTFNIDTSDLIEPALAALSTERVLVLATAEVAAPENARTAAFLPFAEVLPLTDVMVTNGGWGGVLEALAHGIPLIVAGGDLDKPDIAARVGWSRAGIDLGTGTPTPRAIAKAHAALTGDPSYAERARKIAAELASLGGASAAADLIETLLATGEPVRRASSPWV